MALQAFAGFVGPSYVSQSLIADGERCVNWLPEKIESPNAQVPWALYPVPGVTPAITRSLVPNEPVLGPIRGMITRTYQGSEALDFVGGNHVYDSAFVGSTLITTRIDVTGALADSPDPAMLVPSLTTTNLLVSSGGNAYTVGINTGIVTLVTTATHLGFLDSFFLALDSTGLFSISAVNDNTSWDPTQVKRRSVSDDAWQAMKVLGNYIWLFGRRTTDIYYDAQSFPFPFQPQQGATVQAGVHAVYSPAVLDNTVFWLGDTPAGGPFAFKATGLIPQRISGHAQETIWRTYPTSTDAVGWTYAQDGHSFYVLWFRAADKTWVYDAATELWHERSEWDTDPGTNAQESAWRPTYGAFFNGVQYVGDNQAGIVYTLSPSVATDVNGNGMRRVRRLPHMSANRMRLFYHRLEIFLQSGLGLNTGQGSDPQVMLRYSNDGGNTWSNEYWRSAGLQGQYSARVFWTPLGSARDRVFEIVVSDPIAWRMLGAFLDAEAGTS